MKEFGLDTLLSMAGVLASIGVMLGIWWQLRCANIQRRFEALSVLHGNLYGPSMIEALRFIYSKSPEELASPSSEEELAKIEYVVNTFDLVGVKIAKGVLPWRDTLETEWRVLLRLSEKLTKFLDRETEIRRGAPYKEHVRTLMADAQTYKEEHFPDYEVVFFRREFATGGEEPDGRQYCAWRPEKGGKL